MKMSKMTKAEFQAGLKRLGISQADALRRLFMDTGMTFTPKDVNSSFQYSNTMSKKDTAIWRMFFRKYGESTVNG